MDEDFLQYVWKFQKFQPQMLRTTDGDTLSVFDTGIHNFDSGPDFEEARIKIGTIEWAGHVEVHVKSSDWMRHQHQVNPSYENVILHVVWEHDVPIKIKEAVLPTLELRNYIATELVENYQSLMANHLEIVCSNHLNNVSPITFRNMVDKSTSERMNQKAHDIYRLLKESKNHWESVTYRAIMKNFGFSTNKRSFSMLAESLPYHLIAKYSSQPLLLESLLFGQAGFLDEVTDSYQETLAREYGYLKQKHKLEKRLSRSSWKFSKMRPQNFPCIRLAQVASLFHKKPQLFAELIQISDPKALVDGFKLNISDYWSTHYDFGKESAPKPKALGRMSIDNIIINTICPLLFAYSNYSGDQLHKDNALRLLEITPPEKNRITKKWQHLGRVPGNAFESQGLIQLFNEYCERRRCLHCNVGFEILRK
ncbi:MAG: DUF2851 family protein [Bacteroidota bacterium]